MGLVKGTNCGFVTTAPTEDPTDSDGIIDDYAYGLKDTSPTGAKRVTEIGWWCNNATEEADFDVGIYDHNVGDDNPEAIVGVSRNNAKGTDAGWKRVTGLNIEITAETIYWIALQLDNTATTTIINYSAAGGEKSDLKTAQTSLPDPWGASEFTYERLQSIYAVYETTIQASVTNGLKLNDTLAPKTIFNPVLVDALKLNEEAINDIYLSIIENLKINDSGETICEFNVTLSENLKISDVMHAVGIFFMSISESLKIEDVNVTYRWGKVYFSFKVRKSS